MKNRIKEIVKEFKEKTLDAKIKYFIFHLVAFLIINMNMDCNLILAACGWILGVALAKIFIEPLLVKFLH